MNQVPLSKLLIYILVGTLSYSTIVVLLMLTKSTRQLSDIVTALKIVSLVALIAANGELWRKLDKVKDKTLYRANRYIIASSVVITGILTMRFFGVDAENSPNIYPPFAEFIQFLVKYSTWISIAPLLAYGIIDALMVRAQGRTESERLTSKMFLIFNDIACVLPLILISIVGLALYIFGFFGKDEIESLINGALAVTLLASATATKAIEMYYE